MSASHYSYAAEKQRRQAEVAARDALARDLVQRWGVLVGAYNKALPGVERDPALGGTRAALQQFGRELRQHPEAVAALRTRPDEFGMAERPTLAGVLASRSPERAITKHLDGWEAEQRAYLQQQRAEAQRVAMQAALQAQVSQRQSRGPFMR